jgi:heptosyltransferase-3
VSVRPLSDAHYLVIAVARIGDTLLATPLMRAVKSANPQARLTVLVHPRRTEVLEHLSFIDRLGGIDKWQALWRGRIGGASYAAALVLGRDSSLVQYALRVSRRVVAYDEPGFPRDERLARVPPEQGTHAVLDRLRLAQALGFEASGLHLAYRVSDEERARARARLTQRWPRERGVRIGLQMSSFPTKAHRDWPVDHFSALARALVLDVPQARFVLLGDAHARRSASPFVAEHGEHTLVAAGETSLRESAALIAEMDLYIGVDTGPTHIAGALGVPMVALYHCLYPGRNLAPLEHPACRVIEHPLTGDERCAGHGMQDIPVDAVRTAALDLLQSVAQRSRGAA